MHHEYGVGGLIDRINRFILFFVLAGVNFFLITNSIRISIIYNFENENSQFSVQELVTCQH